MKALDRPAAGAIEVKPEAVRVLDGPPGFAARAVEGRANRALVDAVARGLGVRRSAVTLVAGEHVRDKVVEVAGFFGPAGR